MSYGPTPLGIILFWGPQWSVLFSSCRKMKTLHVACKKVEIYFSEIGFIDYNWNMFYFISVLKVYYIFLCE